ncbi:MAG: hypothetical protein KBS91_04220, partial [Firmicutes bacterium]|nr:hypothetical protein [Candidatus Caballimonas caccae]
MVYIALNKDGSCLLKANYGDIKIKIKLENINDVVNEIISLLGADLGGLDIGGIISNLDIKSFFSELGGLNGTGENGVYTYSADTMDLGIPFSIPFDMKVENDSITEFVIDDNDLHGINLFVKLTPFEKPLNIEKDDDQDGRIDLSGIVNYVLTDLD